MLRPSWSHDAALFRPDVCLIAYVPESGVVPWRSRLIAKLIDRLQLTRLLRVLPATSEHC